MSRPRGRSSACATSTATAPPTFSGATPSGDTTIWFMNNGGVVVAGTSHRQYPDRMVGRRHRRLQRRRQGRHSLARHRRRHHDLVHERRHHHGGRPVSAHVPTIWSVAGTGDFNGDGTSDILWHDIYGDVTVWEMSGGTIMQGVSLGNVADQLVDRRHRRLQRRRHQRHSVARYRRRRDDLADQQRRRSRSSRCSATCRRRGASPRPATSTATARATSSGSTPPAT